MYCVLELCLSQPVGREVQAGSLWLTLARLLKFSVPQPPPLQNGDDGICPDACCED